MTVAIFFFGREFGRCAVLYGIKKKRVITKAVVASRCCEHAAFPGAFGGLGVAVGCDEGHDAAEASRALVLWNIAEQI